MDQRAEPEGQGGPGDRAEKQFSPAASSSAATALEPVSSHGQLTPFGASLEPVLLRACEGRLSDVSWFRTDWQRGGAMTGYATYAGDDGQDHRVVVKFPVPPRERRWLMRLQDAPFAPVPRLHAHGEAINGYDLTWIVMERLTHGPLSHAWDGKEFDLLVDAAGRFYRAAHDAAPVEGEPLKRDWEGIYHRARKHVHENSQIESQRWNKALKRLHKKLRKLIDIWEERPIDDWCHGDLHLANAMTRNEPPEGPAVLLDLAEVRPGHWVEDAVYFEHLYWARRDRLGGRKLVSAIAHARKELGLTVDPNWPRLAEIKRLLLALCVPLRLQEEGDPSHLHAALEIIEREAG